MVLDPYAPCPCGSGKKVKWCCQDLFEGVQRAFEQAEQGQEETALRLIDQLAQANANNPEAWGRKAQLLYMFERTQDAENALQKAFDLNPKYPFGLLLRARLLYQEGEHVGSLMLARQAAEAYQPEALDHLFEVYSLIFDAEMRRNNPVAARAALRIVIRCEPSDPELRQNLDTLFGPGSRLPECARRDYSFLSPPLFSPPLPPGERGRGEGADAARREAWDEALSQMGGPRLGAAAEAFRQLTEQDPDDAAAWHNLGLVRAWLGENRKALDSLGRYIELEEDERRAETAAALAEVLRCGQGLEDEADHHEYSTEYQIRDPQPLTGLLQEWHNQRRLIALETPTEGALAAMLLEPRAGAIVTSASEAPPQESLLAGYVVIVGDRVRLWGPRQDAHERFRDEVHSRTELSLQEGPLQTRHAQFADVVAEALLFPLGPGNEQDAKARVLDHARGFFEETWARRPLKSLAGNTPLDAAGHQTLRKRVRGAVRFLQDCAALGMLREYDFDRLRRKLGLSAGAAPVEGAAPDLAAMGAAELAALPVDTLSDEQLEQAYQTALKLDATELSGHFAKALVGRPVRTDRPAKDRFPWYALLVQRALSEGDTDAALDFVNEGERVDCEHNEGRRRDEYELRRGQLHVRRGEADLAHDVFTRLIERSPEDMKFRGGAAEGMLSMRQGDRALRFAEEGLALARRQNDRDSEQYLMELVEAAKKMNG